MNPEINFDQEAFKERNTQTTRISLKVENEEVGYATMKLRQKPFAHYELSFMRVYDEYQGQGLASKLIEEVNAFLDSHQQPGLLIDAVDESSPVKGIYERHGWRPVPGARDYLGYNLSQEQEEAISPNTKSVAA